MCSGTTRHKTFLSPSSLGNQVPEAPLLTTLRPLTLAPSPGVLLGTWDAAKSPSLPSTLFLHSCDIENPCPFQQGCCLEACREVTVLTALGTPFFLLEQGPSSEKGFLLQNLASNPKYPSLSAFLKRP